jgi:large subunit ribosomal protein L25
MANKQQKIELNAQARTAIGGRLSSLRKSGYIPAVLYGKNQEPISLQVPLKDFSKALDSAGESTLVYINVDGQAYPVIIHDVARDPITDNVLHADFYKVRLDQKIKTNVPVEFVGEAPAVRDLQGIFVRNVNELEVEGLPQDLPHELTIDISVLKNFGDQILIKDIKLASGLKLIAEADEIVATVQEPMSEEELQKALEAPTETAEDVKVIEKEKEEEVPEEEGEAPASSQKEGGEQKAQPEKGE